VRRQPRRNSRSTRRHDSAGDARYSKSVVDAPAQGTELLTFGDLRVENPAPGEGLARVLSLKGRWHEGRVTRRGGWLAFEPGEFFVGGMSGSPIVDANGAAIGVVSVSQSSPVILDSLSTQLVRSIVAPAPPVPKVFPA
jgi:hypothetical protein